ncbi:MAG TPA: hypothetical protein VFF13_00670 [archaeon]|nr:hypothetical protein [archaeon]
MVLIPFKFKDGKNLNLKVKEFALPLTAIIVFLMLLAGCGGGGGTTTKGKVQWNVGVNSEYIGVMQPSFAVIVATGYDQTENSLNPATYDFIVYHKGSGLIPAYPCIIGSVKIEANKTVKVNGYC